ncbi:MAG: hypothetical protein IJH44_04085 [Solobacterium sp.]|nr:hypothetical protein [Solobacterium sp.]
MTTKNPAHPERQEQSGASPTSGKKERKISTKQMRRQLLFYCRQAE